MEEKINEVELEQTRKNDELRLRLQAELREKSESFILELVDKFFADIPTAMDMKELQVRFNSEDSAEENARKIKLAAIDAYDVSTEVNGFFYQGVLAWMSKDTRSYVRGGVDAMIASGEKNYPLWLNDKCITLPCEQLIIMLNMLETYAVKCYDVTARHKANVGKLENTQDILAYDYKAGYPSRLEF